VAPAAFAAFKGALLAGIGDQGLAKGESLTFLWSGPSDLVLFVRGVSPGKVCDPKLPRTMFVGFLGDDPGSPEAKAGCPAGVAQLLGSN
jgi:hypothetical protein